MEFTGHLSNIVRDWRSNELQITFAVNESLTDAQINEIKDVDKLVVKAEKWREKRSLDANACLWFCCDKIAKALNTDKWSVYLTMLKRYGKFTYMVVKEQAVESFKKIWRECEVVGSITVNGKPAVQMLCYYGSSLLDSKEFSYLLDGIVSEMKEMGLEPPTPEHIRKAIEKLERQENGKEE